MEEILENPTLEAEAADIAEMVEIPVMPEAEAEDIAEMGEMGEFTLEPEEEVSSVTEVQLFQPILLQLLLAEEAADSLVTEVTEKAATVEY